MYVKGCGLLQQATRFEARTEAAPATRRWPLDLGPSPARQGPSADPALWFGQKFRAPGPAPVDTSGGPARLRLGCNYRSTLVGENLIGQKTFATLRERSSWRRCAGGRELWLTPSSCAARDPCSYAECPGDGAASMPRCGSKSDPNRMVVSLFAGSPQGGDCTDLEVRCARTHRGAGRSPNAVMPKSRVLCVAVPRAADVQRASVTRHLEYSYSYPTLPRSHTSAREAGLSPAQIDVSHSGTSNHAKATCCPPCQ